ncbi:aspartate 1-decarboxylase [Clostridium botulinum]|nr:aspartate 1-decarboxylase [Clostridium sp. M14]NFG40860.1 aspartate 1-decarboxylase [Clostridium botulinum]NFI56625.1 aspartate 1-decarboxylase [Clostridium botulinum]NFI95127.1 aspartate 1-decarboxylase [Clostridium botulinum]NFO92668.1 aspartate 1-decarboxylase [Clostridium botulinum]
MIIIVYTQMKKRETKRYKPKVVFVNEDNTIK